jgi:hypothetical protein
MSNRSSGRNLPARHPDVTRALKRHPGDPAGFPSRSPPSREVVVPAAHCPRRTIHPHRGGDLKSIIFVTSVIRDINKSIIVRAAPTTLVETPVPSGHQLIARARSWGFTSSSSQGVTRATPRSARSCPRFFRSELCLPNRFGLMSLQSLHASFNNHRRCFRNAYRDRVSNSYRVCQLNQMCCALFGYAELLSHTVCRGIRRRNHCLASHRQKLTLVALSCQFSAAQPVCALDFSTERISPCSGSAGNGESVPLLR